MDVRANLWFMQVSTLLLIAVGWAVTAWWVEPRFAKPAFDRRAVTAVGILARLDDLVAVAVEARVKGDQPPSLFLLALRVPQFLLSFGTVAMPLTLRPLSGFFGVASTFLVLTPLCFFPMGTRPFSTKMASGGW